MDKRIGRKAVKQRKRNLIPPNSRKYTLEQAFEIFYKAKITEGLRKRTLNDHQNNFNYFLQWLKQEYPLIQYVDEITPQILRDYVYYMSNEKPLYEGHPLCLASRKCIIRQPFYAEDLAVFYWPIRA